jgi:NADH:ubiquinone oxidoreductase subunit C
MIKIIDKIKGMKCERLISITGMKDSLVYHLENGGKIKELSFPVPAGEEVESLIPLFENAAIFEAEATELFGIKFDGNPISGVRLFQAEPVDGNEEATGSCLLNKVLEEE